MLERESSEEMLEKGVATDRLIPTLQRARDVKGEGPRQEGEERQLSDVHMTQPGLRAGRGLGHRTGCLISYF